MYFLALLFILAFVSGFISTIIQVPSVKVCYYLASLSLPKLMLAQQLICGTHSVVTFHFTLETKDNEDCVLPV